jgi:hypothetical protein
MPDDAVGSAGVVYERLGEAVELEDRVILNEI